MDMSISPGSSKGFPDLALMEEDISVHDLPLEVKIEALNVHIARLTKIRDALIQEAA